jgi:hypothetical protein
LIKVEHFTTSLGLYMKWGEVSQQSLA